MCEAVITASDVARSTKCPLVFAEEGVDEIILRLLQLDAPAARSEPLDRHAGAHAESRSDRSTSAWSASTSSTRIPTRA